jgi:hypothetical protein
MQAFFTKPVRKRISAARTSTSAQRRGVRICGSRSPAREMGPATSCGKKATKSAKSKGSRSAGTRFQ